MVKGQIMNMATFEKYKQFTVTRTWVLEKYWQMGADRARMGRTSQGVRSLKKLGGDNVALKNFGNPKDSGINEEFQVGQEYQVYVLG